MKELKEIFLTFLRKATSTRFVLSLLSIELSALLLMKGYITGEIYFKILVAVVTAYLAGRSVTNWKKIGNSNGGEKDK